MATVGKGGPPVASGVILGFDKVSNQGKYRVPFNRDSYYMTMDMAVRHPDLVVVTNRFANEHLGMKDVVHSECQFGRDYHEYREYKTDEIAQQLTRERGWKWEPNGGFYAQVDCGALRLRSIHWCCKNLPQGYSYLNEVYTGMDGNTYTNFDSVLFRLRWILRKTSSNALGFIGYRAAFDGSPTTQEMQDSPTSMLDENGMLPNQEQDVYATYIQADLYEGYLCAAEMLDYIGGRDNKPGFTFQAAYLRSCAAELKRNFFATFWDNRRGYLAAGAHHVESGKIVSLWDKIAIPAFSLDTRIWDGVPRIQLESYVDTLFSSDMLAAAGVRTRSTESPGYAPGKYHGGSVWPFMSAKIADGLHRQGYTRLARELYRRVVETVDTLKMWPELVPGDTVIRNNEYRIVIYNASLGIEETIEEVAQYVQGWSFTAWNKSTKMLKMQRSEMSPFEERILTTLDIL